LRSIVSVVRFFASRSAVPPQPVSLIGILSFLLDPAHAVARAQCQDQAAVAGSQPAVAWISLLLLELKIKSLLLDLMLLLDQAAVAWISLLLLERKIKPRSPAIKKSRLKTYSSLAIEICTQT
jgi:hypothetical protein